MDHASRALLVDRVCQRCGRLCTSPQERRNHALSCPGFAPSKANHVREILAPANVRDRRDLDDYLARADAVAWWGNELAGAHGDRLPRLPPISRMRAVAERISDRPSWTSCSLCGAQGERYGGGAWLRYADVAGDACDAGRTYRRIAFALADIDAAATSIASLFGHLREMRGLRRSVRALRPAAIATPRGWLMPSTAAAEKTTIVYWRQRYSQLRAQRAAARSVLADCGIVGAEAFARAIGGAA